MHLSRPFRLLIFHFALSTIAVLARGEQIIEPDAFYCDPADTLDCAPCFDAQTSGAAIPQLKAFWEHGPVLKSDDGSYRFHLGGRLEFDNTWYQQSTSLPFELQDGTTMRRARLRADGTVHETIDFVTEVNFANIQEVVNANTETAIGSVGLTDFYLTFKNVPFVENLRVGHFKQPIGLEHRTSANYFYYMERSPGHEAFLQPFQFVSGVMIFDSYWDERATAGLSFARVGKQTITPFSFGAGSGEYALTGRLTALPVYEKDGRRLLHLGIAFNYSGTDNDRFAAANRPLVRAGAGPQLVPDVVRTGTFFTTEPVQIMNVEFATVLNQFSVSAEYQFARGNRLFEQFDNGVFSGPRGNVTYQGVYVEAGLFLNPADYRRFNKQEAVWDRQTTPAADSRRSSRSRFFAAHKPVQLVCRYSFLDLVSGAPVLTSPSGAQAGREHDLTAGVNWHLNSQTHLMVNYVYTALDYVNDTSGTIHGLGCRMHFDF